MADDDQASERRDPDQAWYWTPEWQAGEREVDEDIASGRRCQVFDDVEEFLADLDCEAVERAEGA